MSATLVEGWKAVVDRVAAAERRARRTAGSVRLIAVSKTKPAADISTLLDAGQTLFGENRVQEALAKIDELPGAIEWHLIGHLQKNKARQAVGRFALLHGVDSPALARELNRRAGIAGLVQPVLIQLNLAGEETKSGVAEAELPALLESFAGFEHLKLRGLMSIPPPVEKADESRRWFAGLREALERAAIRWGQPLPELSMGMTDDFEVAIEEGATLVRVGRAIFGER